MTFKELNLSENILSAIESAGYDEPTPIQAAAIPPAIAGEDVLGIAQTGTGKTASFVIPMLTKLERGRARARMPRSLILAPTRELAAQVAETFEQLGVNHKLTIALLIGGVSFDEQFKKLDRGADILIATPGRLLDHFGRGKILLTGVEILVIDEADRMLDMGFIDDIKKICGLLPPKRQTMFFSATMPTEIQKFTKEFLKNPVKIEIERQSTTASTITQRFQFINEDEATKRNIFRSVINDMEIENAIIFCNRKRDVSILLKSMTKHGYSVGALHGDMDQRQRMATLDSFRAGEITYLVASDVAARGLDIPNVGHVFNYDIPIHAEDYVHRIGRTGRAGRTGYAASFISPADKKYFDAIIALSKLEPEWIGEAPADEDFKAKGGRGRGKSERTPRNAKPKSNSAQNENTPTAETDSSSSDQPKKARSPRRARTPKERNVSKTAENRENSASIQEDETQNRASNSRSNSPKSPENNRRNIPKKSREKIPQSTANTSPTDDNSKKHTRKKSNDQIIGMGDHVPAFLMRSVEKSKD